MSDEIVKLRNELRPIACSLREAIDREIKAACQDINLAQMSGLAVNRENRFALKQVLHDAVDDAVRRYLR